MVMARRTRRLWTDEEKRSICLQTTAPGVSVAQVALRYTVNANLIFNWLLEPKYRPRWLIPWPDGAILSQERAEALWDKSVTGAPRPRSPSELQSSDRKLRSPNHPWTNGQMERMNRTIKDATVKPFNHDQLRTHLADFMAAYNFASRLKALGGLTPYEYICKISTSEPDRFILDPIHQMPGLNT